MLSLFYIIMTDSAPNDIEIPNNLTCDTAFELFKVKYSRKYASLREERAAGQEFCGKYTDMKRFIARNDCPYCSVTSIFDQPQSVLLNKKLGSLFKKRHNGIKRSGKINCLQNYCYAANPFKQLNPIPKSIDFREVGLTGKSQQQGGCGSCWAFGTTGLVEALVLRDAESVRKYYPTWLTGTNIEDNRLSVQYFMNNLRGFNDYCNGGDASVAMFEIFHDLKTIEKSSHYPYNPRGTDKSKTLAPMIPESEYYIPLQAYPTL